MLIFIPILSSVAFHKLNFLYKYSIDSLTVPDHLRTVFLVTHHSLHPPLQNLTLLRTKAVILQSLDALPPSQKIYQTRQNYKQKIFYAFQCFRMGASFIRDHI